jgi:hypothetical protein
MKSIRFFCLLCVLELLALSAVAQSYDPMRLGYRLKVGDWYTEHRIMSFFVLPGRVLNIEYQGASRLPALQITHGGQILTAEKGRWAFEAPKASGLTTLTVRPGPEQVATLHIFVLKPFSAVVDGKLDRFRIGEYPKTLYKGKSIYAPPKGFVEVTSENKDTWLSPHYQLSQFVSKQGGGYPKYLVLRTKLLRKLEFLTEKVNSKGIYSNGFHVMSGYRTPYYNALIKNRKWSRHQWGGAADIFVDENPKDNFMDDLNKDGKINFEDARFLASLIEENFSSPEYKEFVGGLGLYRANAAHGPFIHVDVRGEKARW